MENFNLILDNFNVEKKSNVEWIEMSTVANLTNGDWQSMALSSVI